jgi:hypothetical protein
VFNVSKGRLGPLAYTKYIVRDLSLVESAGKVGCGRMWRYR